MADKKQCSEKVVDSTGWHTYPCQKPAKVERDGKWYCTIHDPEYIKTKNAEREERYKSESCQCGFHFPYSHYRYCPFCGTKRKRRNEKCNS